MSFEHTIFRGGSTSVLALVCALALPGGAEAGIKCWTNSEGVRECGNAVPPEYAQGEHTEQSKGGLVVKKQTRSRTQEEVAAERERQAAAAEAKAAAAAKAAKRAKADRVLLDTFSSEDDLVLARDGQLRVPDLLGIVLHPAGLRIDLAELALRHRDDATLRVEHDAARAGGALVEGEQVGHR